ncbi:MAG: hypothetical protein WBB45_00480 [Cyclobacteriaceae bacterium]
MHYQEDIHIYRKFINKQIGISMSVPEDGSDFDPDYYNKIIDKQREIVRYLQYSGLTIGFGGDFRSLSAQGITLSLIQQLSHNSHLKYRQRNLLVNYVAWPISIIMSPADFSENPDKMSCRLISMPKELMEDADPRVFIPPGNINQKYCWARSLSSMRQQMARHMDSRVAICGKPSSYKGFHAGVLEEIYWTMRYNKPVFLLGSFGGVTKDIAAALAGEVPEHLTEEYQRQDYDRANFLDYARLKMGDEFICPNEIITFFNERGLDGLNNGLSEEENEHLIKTNHVSEMITLMIKGLTYTFG